MAGSPKSELIVDTKNNPAADGFLGWIVTIVVCYATLLSPLLVYSPGQETTSETVRSGAGGTNYLNQIFWLGLFASTVFMIWLRKVRIFAALASPMVIAIGAYMLVAFISALWSPVPHIALRRAVAQTILIATVLLPIASTHDYARQIDRVAIVFIIVTLVNIIPIMLFPPSSLGHIGIYSHKNELGLVMAFAFMCCIYSFIQFGGIIRLISFFCIPLSLVELWLSQSKTSFGLAIVVPIISAFAVLIQMSMGINLIFTIIFGLFVSVIAYLYCSYLFDFSFSDVSMIMFGDPTFTGRTIIWDFLSGVIARAPLLGQGYGSFWDIGDWSILKREAPGYIVYLLQGHNGYVDIIVDLGIIGFCIFAVSVVMVIYNVGAAGGDSRKLGRVKQWLFFNILLFALLHNVLESSWFRGYELVWLLFLATGFWAQQMHVRGTRRAESQ